MWTSNVKSMLKTRELARQAERIAATGKTPLLREEAYDLEVAPKIDTAVAKVAERTNEKSILSTLHDTNVQKQVLVSTEKYTQVQLQHADDAPEINTLSTATDTRAQKDSQEMNLKAVQLEGINAVPMKASLDDNALSTASKASIGTRPLVSKEKEVFVAPETTVSSTVGESRGEKQVFEIIKNDMLIQQKKTGASSQQYTIKL
jgi:hypothetical protein